MALEWPNMVVAIGKTNGAPNASPVAMLFQRGGVLTRTGAGVYPLTLEAALPAAEGIVLITPYLAGAANPTWYRVTDTTDLVKTIETFVGAAATDVAFGFVVLHTPGGNA